MSDIKNNIKNEIKCINKKIAEEERKTKLEKILQDRKIENTKQSLCKSYIKFEKPNLEELLGVFEKEQNKKESRLLKLIKTLKENKMEYDEKIPVFENYIKDGGELKNIIKDAKLEKSLIYNTKYENYLKYNSVEIARYLATIEFMNSGKKCNEVKKFASQNNTLNFL
jgi:hypothetical protein